MTSTGAAPASTAVSRRRLLVGGAAAGSALLLSSWPAGAVIDPGVDPGPAAGPTVTGRAFSDSLSESPDKGIMFPVLPNSAAQWSDTYGACRGGCSRAHQGQDLMAPKMTKILACVTGTIVEFRHRSDGNALWIQGDDGWFYSFLHINNDRPGTDDKSNLAEYAWAPKLRQYVGNEAAARGVRVLRGEHIAYVGDSGNAEGSGSHLHFEIRKPASGSFSSETQRLWASASVNPRVSLQNAQPAAERPQVDPAVFSPWNNATDFITAQYRDYFGRTPTSGDIAYYGEMLNSGTRTPDWLVQMLLESREGDSMNQSVARIYLAAYDRLPDSAGYAYWLDRRRKGWSLNRIGQQFTQAPEFVNKYGSVTNEEFVDLVYRNVLGRAADDAGRTYWLSALAAGTTRGKVLIHFSESAENKARLRTLMHVYACYGAMLVRTPNATERGAWTSVIDDVDSTQPMVTMVRGGSEYRARILN